MKGRHREDVAIVTTPEVRRQLKIVAAMTGSTMKEVLARLVSAEMKRVSPEVKGMRSLFKFAFVGLFITSLPRTSKAIVILAAA